MRSLCFLNGSFSFTKLHILIVLFTGLSTLGISSEGVAQDSGPHVTVGGVQITISRGATSDHRPIGATKTFRDTDRSISFVFHNQSSQTKRIDIKLVAEDVEGLSPNADYSDGWVRIPAGQRHSVTFNAPTTGLIPGTYRFVANAGASGSTRFVVESRYASARLLQASDVLSQPNIALAALGGTVRASSSGSNVYTQDHLNDGVTSIRSLDDNSQCTNCGWAADKSDKSPSIVVGFNQQKEAEIDRIVLDTRRFLPPRTNSGQITDNLPKLVSVSVSTLSQSSGFEEVATVRLKRELGRHSIDLTESVRAKFVRIDIEETYGDVAVLMDIEIYETASTPRSIVADARVNLALPSLGGSIVTYTDYHDKWPASRLFDRDPRSTWVSNDDYFPQDFTIAFKNNQLAEIDHVDLTIPSDVDAIAWPSEVAIALSTDNPLDGFVEIGRHQIEKRAGTQSFPVGQEARFVKVRILNNYGATKTAIAEIAVIEGRKGGRPSLLFSAPEDLAMNEADEVEQPLHSDYSENEPNNEATNANALISDSTIKGKIDPLGEVDYFALPALGQDATALTLAYDGRPYIRHGLELLDSAGNVLGAFDPGDLPARDARLTFALEGNESHLRLSEPPASVVVIWDTSGSMRGSEADLERAVRDYIRLAPESQAIKLIRFSNDVENVTPGFASNKTQLLAAMGGKFKPDGGTSLYDAISAGIDSLEDRQGNKGILVMTDGANNGRLWHDKLWQKIEGNPVRLYTIGLGSGLQEYSAKYASTGERILGHLSLGTNGESFFATESTALRAFYSRIAKELADPAIYLLTPRVELGHGSIRLVAVGEQVPSAAMPSIHVIFDVSGSMARALPDGRSRIRAGKEAMVATTTFLPEDTPFGLTLYGRRLREGDGKERACTDIETVYEGPFRRDEIIDFVNKLQPRGGTTPLARSIDHVVRNFEGENGGVIVAITDGIEECDPQPLVTVERLKSLGLQHIELNVIGFDLRDEASKRMMQQIADLGGGAYYDATDSATLAAALKDAITARYDVLDATGRVVASGQIDGPPQDVPAGFYTVEIAASTGANRTLDVRIDRDLMTMLRVNKVGSEMDIAVSTPSVFDPLHECGVLASKSTEGRDRVRRIQQKLNQLGFDAGVADGIAGSGTLGAVTRFLDQYQINQAPGASLIVEQHLDCVVEHGRPYSEVADAPEVRIRQAGAAVTPPSPDKEADLEIEVAENRTDAVETENPATEIPMRGRIGIRIQTITDEIADIMNLDRAEGVLIAGFGEDSPAQRAGVLAGDVILDIDGKKIVDLKSMRQFLAETPAGKALTLSIWRSGEVIEFQITTEKLVFEDLGELPVGDHPIHGFGIAVADMSAELRDRLELPDTNTSNGAIVTLVLPGTSANDEDIRPGDLIVEVNQQAVNSAFDVQELIQRRGKKKVLLLREREGDLRFVVIEPGVRNSSPTSAIPQAGEGEPNERVNATYLGFSAAALSDHLREQYDIDPSARGVVITKIQDGSSAAAENLRPGDVIQEVSQVRVTSTADMSREIERSIGGNKNSILLLISRKGDLRFVALRFDR